MSKNWTGNDKSIYVTNGCSSHSESERESNDFYATDPRAVEDLLSVESFSNIILEPCVGEGHIAKVLKSAGKSVFAMDIIDRGWPQSMIRNYLEFEPNSSTLKMDVITNPPYKYAKEFVEKSIDILDVGCKIAMFLKLTFLESIKRRELFDNNPPKRIYVYSKRIACAKNGDFSNTNSAVAYAWFIWEKGFKGFPELRWI